MKSGTENHGFTWARTINAPSLISLRQPVSRRLHWALLPLNCIAFLVVVRQQLTYISSTRESRARLQKGIETKPNSQESRDDLPTKMLSGSDAEGEPMKSPAENHSCCRRRRCCTGGARFNLDASRVCRSSGRQWT